VNGVVVGCYGFQHLVCNSWAVVDLERLESCAVGRQGDETLRSDIGSVIYILLQSG